MAKFKLLLKRIFGNRFITTALSAYFLGYMIIMAEMRFWLIMLTVFGLAVAICLLFDFIGFLNKKFLEKPNPDAHE